MKRWLYLVHRWLGIVLCLVMAAWFLSGIVMLYVGYPKLTDAERLQALPELPASGCCVPMAQALQAAGLALREGRAAAGITWRLTTVGDAPTYVFGDGTVQHAVDARSGRRIEAVTVAQALRNAGLFAGGAPVRPLGTVQEDAWTHSRALDAHRPLHRVAVDEPAGRWLYVSSRTGEVVRDASATERGWGWIGAWLHWLYMFRGGWLDGWWHEIVIALSLAGGVLALAGLVVGLMRWRFRQPYRHGTRTPYTGAMARWHHLLGLAGGVLAITWVLSGLLSVNPWKVFDAGGPRPDRLAYAGGPLRAGEAPEAARALAQLQARGLSVRELVWRRIGGRHVVLAHTTARVQVLDAQGLLDDGVPQALWLAAAQAMLPSPARVQLERLDAYDAHYLAREPHTMSGHRERPLPAVRLRFDDPNATWVTIDPRSGEIVQISDSHRRAERWLFAFLHSFDLPALLSARPGWDLWMVGFSLAGLGLALTGTVTGAARLRRKRVRRRRAAREAVGAIPT